MLIAESSEKWTRRPYDAGLLAGSRHSGTWGSWGSPSNWLPASRRQGSCHYRENAEFCIPMIWEYTCTRCKFEQLTCSRYYKSHMKTQLKPWFYPRKIRWLNFLQPGNYAIGRPELNEIRKVYILDFGMCRKFTNDQVHKIPKAKNEVVVLFPYSHLIVDFQLNQPRHTEILKVTSEFSGSDSQAASGSRIPWNCQICPHLVSHRKRTLQASQTKRTNYWMKGLQPFFKKLAGSRSEITKIFF